jgi:hypothetical protein
MRGSGLRFRVLGFPESRFPNPESRFRGFPKLGVVELQQFCVEQGCRGPCPIPMDDVRLPVGYRA